ncbi:hypothetical protein BC941DRAFT_430531 [Chlamydoabsidia padenii]|nr:hypothetical protein BC941DRAFT_430531 [Chlamydoabsidia padenii]
MKTLLFSCLLVLFVGFVQLAHGFTTRNEAQKYLIRYGITHDEMDDNDLLATVKQYRDMAVLNTELFGERVERLLQGLDQKLASGVLTDPHQRKRLIKDIERVLRQLEVQGQLTRDHVHDQLMDANNKVAVSSSHFLTPEQWQQVVKDVVETVNPPSSWTSWLSRSSSPIKIGDKDPYHTWLDQTTVSFSSWLPKHKQKTLKAALDKAMKRQELGSKDWWRQLLKELHGFSDDELETTIDQLRIQVIGFKVFLHDYLGLPTPPPVYEDEHSWAEQSDYGVVNTLRVWYHRWVYRPVRAVINWFSRCRQHLDHQATTFLAEKKAQTQHVHDEWAQSIKNAKQSFANYWLEREKEAYRRIGYTEGEIAWIHGYLNKALTSSSSHSITQIIDDVRRHLNSVGRQTKAQVELQVLKLERLLQAWNISIMRAGHHEL